MGHHGQFTDLDRDAGTAVIDVNVVAVTRLAHAAARAMVDRGAGGILNVSSVAGFAPTPGFAVYGATKAFVISLGEALAVELAGSGVTLTTVCPGLTRTEFQERAGYDAPKLPDSLWQSPDEVATTALEALRKGRPRAVPGVPNKVAVAGSRLLPTPITRRISRFLSDRR
ncbi:MAG: SDR family NAD(P)-dependent oxidoreductase [Acidimicrobiales bacterium]